ncbi:helix-turn-helix transcriptional regulator [Streptomyces sp. H10-C2]|uniref:helix-turn-helix domain-containing protein n=1 Tax=unclassified Streptomyces TaxID=2593676 RepID=UPI0024BA8639|nr:MULTISPECIES: helix-turn-helix transcriptional regulator [unclassified Streptomyces]MDJ0341481.1 helix-turn-helix transcriptional regulator [Streptomyces sp. PH10-H1]MDJ0369138.1 helix-turn-helix transcriptional regulator [Streptomyces sp. H10-C2]
MNHTRWKLARERKITASHTESPEVKALRINPHGFRSRPGGFDRRTELGLSQTGLARLAHMTQPPISKLELGGTIPTLPLLVRLATVLDASLNIALDGNAADVVFTPHAA